MKKLKRLTQKQMRELKKALHKIEYDMALEVVNDINKVLNNSSELRQVIIDLEKRNIKLEKEIERLNHKIDVLNQAIDIRDSSILELRRKHSHKK